MDYYGELRNAVLISDSVKAKARALVIASKRWDLPVPDVAVKVLNTEDTNDLRVSDLTAIQDALEFVAEHAKDVREAVLGEFMSSGRLGEDAMFDVPPPDDFEQLQGDSKLIASLMNNPEIGRAMIDYFNDETFTMHKSKYEAKLRDAVIEYPESNHERRELFHTFELAMRDMRMHQARNRERAMLLNDRYDDITAEARGMGLTATKADSMFSRLFDMAHRYEDFNLRRESERYYRNNAPYAGPGDERIEELSDRLDHINLVRREARAVHRRRLENPDEESSGEDESWSE